MSGDEGDESSEDDVEKRMQNHTYERHHRVIGCIMYFKNIFKFIIFGSKIKPPQGIEFDKKTILKQLSESILFISK